MSKVKFGGIQPNPKEAKVWLHPHDGLKTYNQKKQEWTGGGSSNDAPDEPESLYEFVDLGLPSGLLWATTNVGANSPEEYGLYFAWGETEGYEGITEDKQFLWKDYKWCAGSRTTLTKYNNNISNGTIDDLNTLELSDDAAYVSDKNCRMPTYDDLIELINNTTSEWETLNGAWVMRFTSKTNGNSIFIPVAGSYDNGGEFNIGYTCYLWSSSLYENGSVVAWHLTVFSSDDTYIGVDHDFLRKSGLSVRPVQDPK